MDFSFEREPRIFFSSDGIKSNEIHEPHVSARIRWTQIPSIIGQTMNDEATRL